MELDNPLHFCIGSHYHDIACVEACVVRKVLNAGANVNSHCCLLTPLQIAARNWYLPGVEILLEYDADPDGVGQLDGFIPAHINTTWAQSSPLHILRSAEYGHRAIDSEFRYSLGV